MLQDVSYTNNKRKLAAELSLVPYDEIPKNTKALSEKPRKLTLLETREDYCTLQCPLQV